MEAWQLFGIGELVWLSNPLLEVGAETQVQVIIW